MLAKDIMTVDVLTVRPEDTVEDVIKLLLDNRISGVPVVNGENEVVGIVTEGDLMVKTQKLHVPSYIQILGGVIYLDDPEDFREELKKSVAIKVEDMMTTDPLTVEEDTPVDEIATIMSDSGINRLPVVRDDRLMGIVSRADIIRSMARKG
ncbi:MAG: CBS domain-containing protein [Eubacteriales bacterium]